MNDLRDALSELVRAEEPRARGPEHVRADAGKRRVRQRVASTILGVAVAVGATSLVIRGFGINDHPPKPVEPQPIDVSSLHRVWSADVPSTSVGAFQNVDADADHVYVGTATGVIAYPKDCADPCPPVWRAVMVKEPSRESASIAVGEGIVAATLEGHLSVFGSACGIEGALCTPLWRSDPPAGANGYLEPVIGDGVVKTTLSVGEMPDHHVWAVGFAARCRTDGESCDPSWRGDLGVGTAFFPAPYVDGVFYQQVGLRLLGFAASCSSDGGPCQPDLLVRLDGEPGSGASVFLGPVARGGEVVVTTGTGLIRSFPAHCRESCRPLWAGDASEYAGGSPVRAGDLVVVSGDGGTAAFPFGCSSDGGLCAPRWVSPVGGGEAIPTGDRAVASVGGKDRSVVTVFPIACPATCEPRWSVGDLGQIQGAESDGRTLFIAHQGQVDAYPIDCADPCVSQWRADLPGETWTLLLDGRHLIAMSRLDADQRALPYGKFALTAFASSS